MRRYNVLILGMLFSMLICMSAVQGFSDPAYIKINMLNQDPDPAEQGEYLDLRWKVVKLGNQDMDNLTFKLEPEYPFYLDKIDKQIKEVGPWQGYSDEDEYYIVHYKVRVAEDAIEDTYDMDLSYKFGEDDTWSSREYEVRVGEKKDPNLVLGSITTSPEELVADTDNAKLEVEVENIGDEDVQNLKADLILPEGITPSYSYSDRDNLGNINADTSATAKYYVDIDEDIESKEHDAKLELKYKEKDDDDNVYRNKTIDFKLPVMNKPRYEIVNFETTPENIQPNDEVNLKFVVKNVGDEEGESVSLRAYKESSQPFEFEEKSDFIGKLKPGEKGEAVLILEVEEDANVKDYQLDLEVRSIFKDEVLTESEKANFKVVNGKDEISSILIFNVIAVVVVAGVGLFFYARSKKS